MAGKLTKAQRKTLEWFAVISGASLFGPNDPSLRMVKKLRDQGLLSSERPARGGYGAFLTFKITEAGLAALKAQPMEGE
jgi:hypothetical protein